MDNNVYVVVCRTTREALLGMPREQASRALDRYECDVGDEAHAQHRGHQDPQDAGRVVVHVWTTAQPAAPARNPITVSVRYDAGSSGWNASEAPPTHGDHGRSVNDRGPAHRLT